MALMLIRDARRLCGCGALSEGTRKNTARTIISLCERAHAAPSKETTSRGDEFCPHVYFYGCLDVGETLASRHKKPRAAFWA